MRRWLGRLWRVVKWGAVVALVVLVAWAWGLPWLVERRIERQLRAAGAEGASVTVHRVGTGRAELGAISLGGEERLAVDSASVTYELGELAGGRVKTLTLSGAQLVLTLNDDGRLEWGDLAELEFGGEGEAEAWPFEKIELHHSAVLIETPTSLIRVPMQGLISANERALTLGLTAEGLTGSARLSGRVDRTEAGWATENLQLLVNGGSAVVGGYAVEGVRGNLSLRGEMGEGGGRLELTAGSRLQAEGIGGTGVGPIERAGVSVTDEPLVVRFGGAAGPTVEGGRVRVSATAGRMGRGAIAVEGVDASATLAVGLSEGEVRATLTEAAAIELNGVGGLPISAEAWRVVAAEDGEALARYRLADGSLNFAATVEAIGPIVAGGGAGEGLSATAKRVAIEAAGSWDGADELTASGLLRVEGGRAEHEGAKATAEGVSIAAPIAFGQAGTAADIEAGGFEVATLRWRGAEVPGPRGRLAIADGRATLSAQWQPVGPINVTLDGEADVEGVRLAVDLPRVELIDPLLLAEALPMLEGWEIDGTFAGGGTLNWSGGDWRPRLTLDLDDLAVRSRAYDAQLNGISGSVALERFTPPLTPADQELRIASAEIGRLRLREGLLGFRLESPRRLFVERMRWTMGRASEFRVHAFRFDLDEPAVETDIFVERMNLADWLGVLTDEAVSGSGELYGRIPVTFEPDSPRRKLMLGEGFLYSRPGAGNIRVRDREMMAGLLEQAGSGAPSGQSIQRGVMSDVLDALSDFEYSVLMFDFIERADDLTLRIEVRGRGRRGEGASRIDPLVINVNGFGSTINEALIIGMTPRRSVDRALESFFERVNP